MSIKDLFGNSKNYVSDTNQKDAFADAESSKNVKAISEKQNSFEPQIDYSDPQTFAKYGSAEQYYKSAIDRILDFYPYDGSDAEYNSFYNKSLDIEKYIFNNLYPRTNGYVDFAGSSYISLKGGPHTIAASNTKGLIQGSAVFTTRNSKHLRRRPLHNRGSSVRLRTRHKRVKPSLRL